MSDMSRSQSSDDTLETVASQDGELPSPGENFPDDIGRKGQEIKNIFLNPRECRKIIRYLSCLNYVETPKLLKNLNIIYIGIALGIQATVILQGFIWTGLAEKVAVKVESVHYTLCVTIIVTYIINELSNYRDLTEAWEILVYIHDNYSNCDLMMKERLKIQKRNALYVNRIFSFFMTLCAVGLIGVAPVRAAISGGPMSLPVPLYIPFDTTHNPGYLLALMWEAFSAFHITMVGTCSHLSYLGYMGALRAELEILNHSIIHIEDRAARKFGVEEVTKETYKDPNFQICMNECLRQDIIHHQLLLRYFKLTKAYLGFSYLWFILVASIILAAAGYLLTMPDSTWDDVFKFVPCVLAEMTYIFALSLYSELIINESSNLHTNLFWGPWYHCNKSFKDSIKIMLCGTLKPIQLKTNVFNIAVSLETFNSVVTTAFQYFNLLMNRQTK